jgi:hypothetical protein
MHHKNYVSNSIFLVAPAVQNTVWFVTKYIAVFVSSQTQKLVRNKRSNYMLVQVNKMSL